MIAQKNKAPVKKMNYAEDNQNPQLFLNPFKDLSKPFRHHLDLPNELIERALGEELESTKRHRRGHSSKTDKESG